MTSKISREIRLKNRPEGLPAKSDFELAEVTIPAISEGEILVQNMYMSVDPYMRGRMRDLKSYLPPFQIGKPLEGGCVGRVIESKNAAFKVGDYVLSMLGWREYFVSGGEGLTKIDPELAPVQAYLGAVGLTGMTAYVGLLHIGKLKEGETVFSPQRQARWDRLCVRSQSLRVAMWSAAPALMKRSPGLWKKPELMPLLTIKHAKTSSPRLANIFPTASTFILKM